MGSDCISSLSLLSFYFTYIHTCTAINNKGLDNKLGRRLYQSSRKIVMRTQCAVLHLWGLRYSKKENQGGPPCRESPPYAG